LEQSDLKDYGTEQRRKFGGEIKTFSLYPMNLNCQCNIKEKKIIHWWVRGWKEKDLYLWYDSVSRQQ